MLSRIFWKSQSKITGAAKINTLTILAVILLAGSFALSAVLTKLAAKLALKTGLLAKPAADRYHQSVVPLGGGIAIFATIALIILTAIAVVKFLIEPGYLNWLGESVIIHTQGFLDKIAHLMIVLLCIFTLFTLGLIDDKKHLGPYLKLAVQFAVALTAAFFADIRVELFIQNRIVTSLLSAFWIVLIINVFNFLDNMDGASAGIAAIASLILLTAAAQSGQVFIGAMAVIFIGTLLGFLVFNFPPAKIFAGDAG